MIFGPVISSKLGVFSNENYRIVSCFDGHIEFSYAQKGGAMTAHFASDRIGLRKIKQAVNEFCEMIFLAYTDINCIYAAICKKRPGIIRMVKKVGFKYIAEDQKHFIYEVSR